MDAKRRGAKGTGAVSDLFQRTFDHAPVGMAHVSLDGRFLRVNDRLCEITGYPREELVGKPFPDITHPEDLAADLGQADRLGRGEIGRYGIEKRYLRKDGSPVWVELHGSLPNSGRRKSSFGPVSGGCAPWPTPCPSSCGRPGRTARLTPATPGPRVREHRPRRGRRNWHGTCLPPSWAAKG